MRIIHDPLEMQQCAVLWRNEQKTIGLVPTMGALHEGHLSLVDRVRPGNDIVVMSLFVNPRQFGPTEDLDKYPRTLEADRENAEHRGVDILFVPSAESMYPQGYATTVHCGGITERLEGAARPGHFDGVTTVVLKLFLLVQPTVAVFGQKDIQQALVIQQMVRDLHVPVNIDVAPIVRESDGLAMSSRNRYLSEAERHDAGIIFRALLNAQKRFSQGEKSASVLRQEILEYYELSPYITPEYVAITDSSCTELEDVVSPGTVISVVCRTNQSQTRLLDNVILHV